MAEKNSASTNNIVIICAYIFAQYQCYLGFNPGMTKSYPSINFYQYTSQSPSKKSVPIPNPAYSESKPVLLSRNDNSILDIFDNLMGQVRALLILIFSLENY